MQLSSWFTAALAGVPVVVLALPASPIGEGADDGYIETILYKRDDVLTPRDIALAESHGVNVTESANFARVCTLCSNG